MARARRGGGLPPRVGSARPAQPHSRGDGARLLPPVRDGLQPRQARRGRVHPCRRALPRRPRHPRGMASACSGSADRQARPRHRRRTERSVGCVSPRSRWAMPSPFARPLAPSAGMMRYGIPRYRLPREVLDAEIARIVASGGARRDGSARRRRGSRQGGGRFRRLLRGHRRAPREPRRDPRGGRDTHLGSAPRFCMEWRTATRRPASAGASQSMGAVIRPSTSRAR